MKFFSYPKHTRIRTGISGCTLLFVTRFTAEELPPYIKKCIEEGFQEWEENFLKVSVNSSKLMNDMNFTLGIEVEAFQLSSKQCLKIFDLAMHKLTGKHYSKILYP